ncbi:hypothetical protein MRX96_042411 [Rhipicephalus microplus]
MSAPSATDVKVDDSVFFHNGDKQKIVCKSWRAESEPRALVFLSHGYAEHCHEPSYDTLARALVGIGCYVFSHDHVGHGMSEGASCDGQVCRRVRGRHPQARGH